MKLPLNYSRASRQQRREARELYAIEQDGRCLHCKGFLHKPPPDRIINTKVNKKLFPLGFFDFPLHLHHDHNTDLTIGVVHARCNAILWQYHGK